MLIWDTSRWELVRKIEASENEVNAASFSADGKTVATVDDDGVLKLWETATGECRHEAPAHTGNAIAVRFSPDGTSIVTGGRKDGRVAIRDRLNAKVRGGFRADQGISKTSRLHRMARSWQLRDRKASSSGRGRRESSSSRYRIADPPRELHSRTTGRPWPRRTKMTTTRCGSGMSLGVASCVKSAVTSTAFTPWPSQRMIGRSTRRATTRRSGPGTRPLERRLANIWAILAESGISASRPKAERWPPPARTARSSSGTSSSAPDCYRLPVTAPRTFGFSRDGRTLLVFELEPRWSVSRWDVRSGSLVERTPMNSNGPKTSLRSPMTVASWPLRMRKARSP